MYCQAFHVAGTKLSWKHLCQILKSSSTPLTDLSWTWDNQLEESLRQNNNYSLETQVWSQLLELGDKLQLLKILLFHIPTIFNLSNLIVTSHSALCYFVSLCKNLEELWIFSWPRTPTEMKFTTTFNKEHFHPDMNFPNLHTFVLSVMEPPKIYVPRLVSFLVKSFDSQIDGDGQLRLPRKLWLDHPLLNLHLTEGSGIVVKLFKLMARYL